MRLAPAGGDSGDSTDGSVGVFVSTAGGAIRAGDCCAAVLSGCCFQPTGVPTGVVLAHVFNQHKAKHSTRESLKVTLYSKYRTHGR